MAKRIAVRTVASLIAVVLGLSVGRAATSRYAEQAKQIMNAAEAERKRLNLSDDELAKRYPTPSMQLARTLAKPGSTVEVVAKGTFQPGTKFLLDNDAVAAVPPTAEPAGGVYRVKIQIPKNAMPGEVSLVAFAPVSGKSSRATVLLIGGTYQLDATAISPPDASLEIKDWRVRFTLQIADTSQSGKAEFFHGNDARAFRVRTLDFSFPRDPEGEWNANLQLTQEDIDKLESADAEKGKLEASLDDPTLAAPEREKIQARLAKLAQQQEEQEKAAAREPECVGAKFRVAQGTVDGVLECQNGRTLNLKGALKPAGQ